MLCPGNRMLLEVASMVVTWWIVAFVPSVSLQKPQGYELPVPSLTIVITGCLFDANCRVTDFSYVMSQSK